MSQNFKDKLKEALARQNHRVCLGFDPDTFNNLHVTLKDQLSVLGPEKFLVGLFDSILSELNGLVAVVKFQSAYFEAHGAAGFSALKQSIEIARSRNCFVILDCKRGDISSTMEAYGRMAFDYFEADALTVTPYLGASVLSALAPWLSRGGGVYAVWVSSNPDGELVQKTIQESLLRQLAKSASDGGFADGLGLVVGATKLATLSTQLREQIAGIPCLMPGFGAQGASKDRVVSEFIKRNQLAVFPISRAIVDLGLPVNEVPTRAAASMKAFIGSLQ